MVGNWATNEGEEAGWSEAERTQREGCDDFDHVPDCHQRPAAKGRRTKGGGRGGVERGGGQEEAAEGSRRRIVRDHREKMSTF